MNKHQQAQHDEMIRAARRFAAANPSDPFALARALKDVRLGVSTYRRGTEDKDFGLARDMPGYSDAQPSTETRQTAAGEDYTVQTFRNVARI